MKTLIEFIAKKHQKAESQPSKRMICLTLTSTGKIQQRTFNETFPDVNKDFNEIYQIMTDVLVMKHEQTSNYNKVSALLNELRQKINPKFIYSYGLRTKSMLRNYQDFGRFFFNQCEPPVRLDQKIFGYFIVSPGHDFTAPGTTMYIILPES